LDFRKSPEDSRLIINQWISDQTHEKIKDLLPSGSITPDVRSVLTNAIYFKAAWQGSFKREKTRDEKFTLLNGSQVIGPMMHGEVRTLYAKGDGYEVFRLPYENVELSMIILLPQIGKFETVEQALDESHLNEIIESWKDTAVILTMPKFTFSSDIGLKEKLSELGMAIAFTDAADFSGMTGGKDLTIYDVLHKAFISVDEEGTEAAAATGVIFGVTSMPETVTVVMDRPFIFLIHDRKTNTILFMGHVVNPLNE
jgi:serpin B